MNDVQLAIKALIQQWSIEGRATTDQRRRERLERQIFGLEILCTRLGYDSLEVDAELERATLNVAVGA